MLQKAGWNSVKANVEKHVHLNALNYSLSFNHLFSSLFFKFKIELPIQVYTMIHLEVKQENEINIITFSSIDTKLHYLLQIIQMNQKMYSIVINNSLECLLCFVIKTSQRIILF